MEIIEYKNFSRCCRISNGIIELAATLDFGPRIIRFGFIGQDNEFMEHSEYDRLPKDQWRLVGGHRLWHGPEVLTRTYYPDNDPIRIEQFDQCVRLIQPVESTTGIQKEIDITLSADQASVLLRHRLVNTGLWAVELAPWALSVMAPGGAAIIPLPPRIYQPRTLLPESTITLWGYTNMADPRWKWGSQYVMLFQNPAISSPQKAGFSVPDGWAAYARNGHLFVKKFEYLPGAKYPDFGASAEVYTDGSMLELETLGPLVTLPPGGHVEYVEQWRLVEGIEMPAGETDIENTILPLVL